MIINRSYFLKRVRESLFSGRLSRTQADGLTRILDYRDAKWPNMPDAELAYVLATAKWETAHTMQPISGRGSQAYLRSKPYWPWIGRGLVQITWKKNYEKYGIDKPEKALEWPTALHVLFHGMIFGEFTGKKLADFIGARKRDYVGARAIVNGSDKAKQIALIAEGFWEALKQARETGDVLEGEKQTTGKALSSSKTAAAAAAGGVASSLPAAVETVKQAQEAAEAGKGLWDVAASVGPWVLLALLGAAFAVYIIWQRKLQADVEGV